MQDNIHLLILSPQKKMLDQMVCKVSLPGTKGRFMVLYNHAPLISSLEEGEIVYVSDNKEGRMSILSGFVEVNNNKVTVCVEI